NSDVISGVKERLSQVTSGNTKKIFLLIGINDISHNLSVDEIAKRYDSLVKEIKEQTPSTKLYIQSIMPINNDYGRYKNLQGKESIVIKVNERLKSIADENNATFIDLFPALSDREGKLKKEYTNDGLHLLGNGYKAWANHIKEYVIE
ncbi:MAG: sialate O-acetylesterase, partial [Muribaculaceae bacterium]|nr:sialate O-acetylesterase [Muribaculaceae bacterium]